MPIKTSCPECNRPYNLADEMEGKTVKCKECNNTFTVNTLAEVLPANPPNGKVKTSVSTTTKTVVKAAKRRQDDDDEDDSRVRKSKKNKGGGMSMGLLIGGGVAALLLLLACGGIGVGALVLMNRSSKESPNTSEETPPLAQLNAVPNPIAVPAPNPNLGVASPITKANFDRIRGGMREIEVMGFLFAPTNLNPPFDADTANYDQATTRVWQNGADTITVTFCRSQAAHWVGEFGGQTFTMQDQTYILVKANVPNNPNPNGSTKLTKANFDKIKGGMRDINLQILLGPPTTATAPVDPAAQPVAGPNGKAQVWQNGQDSITVTYCNGRATRWVAMIDGQAYGPVDDPTYAYKANNPANPNPSTTLTKANYNGIIVNATTDQALFQFYGKPTVQSPPITVPATKFKPASTRYLATWTDGQGGQMTITFTNSVVSHKTEAGLK